MVCYGCGWIERIKLAFAVKSAVSESMAVLFAFHERELVRYSRSGTHSGSTSRFSCRSGK